MGAVVSPSTDQRLIASITDHTERSSQCGVLEDFRGPCYRMVSGALKAHSSNTNKADIMGSFGSLDHSGGLQDLERRRQAAMKRLDVRSDIQQREVTRMEAWTGSPSPLPSQSSSDDDWSESCGPSGASTCGSLGCGTSSTRTCHIDRNSFDLRPAMHTVLPRAMHRDDGCGYESDGSVTRRAGARPLELNVRQAFGPVVVGEAGNRSPPPVLHPTSFCSCAREATSWEAASQGEGRWLPPDRHTSISAQRQKMKSARSISGGIRHAGCFSSLASTSRTVAKQEYLSLQPLQRVGGASPRAASRWDFAAPLSGFRHGARYRS